MGTEQAGWSRILLVASTGGHLDELVRLAPRLVPHPVVLEWATFETEQSRHLLDRNVVHYVPMIKPRDLSAMMRAWPIARSVIAKGRFDAIVTTGAAIALPFLLSGSRRFISRHYIESAARSTGPSLTGRLVGHIPGVHLYTQYGEWATSRWAYRGSVFDGFRTSASHEVRPIDRVVVTLGTQRDFGFERAVLALIPALKEVCSSSATVLWQTGATKVAVQGIRAHDTIPTAELRSAIADADLVVGHAGVGTALMTLESGRCPVLLPRRQTYREHTDDHQLQIAGELHRRQLAVARDPGELRAEDLVEASCRRTLSVSTPPDMHLTV